MAASFVVKAFEVLNNVVFYLEDLQLSLKELILFLIKDFLKY